MPASSTAQSVHVLGHGAGLHENRAVAAAPRASARCQNRNCRTDSDARFTDGQGVVGIADAPTRRRAKLATKPAICVECPRSVQSPKANCRRTQRRGPSTQGRPRTPWQRGRRPRAFAAAWPFCDLCQRARARKRASDDIATPRSPRLSRGASRGKDRTRQLQQFGEPPRVGCASMRRARRAPLHNA